MAGDEPFVHDDVEGVNLALHSADSEEVWLSTDSPSQMFVNAAAGLQHKMKYSHKSNKLIEPLANLYWSAEWSKK